MRYLILFVLVVAAALAIQSAASKAEQRIAQRIPGRVVDVSLIRMQVRWEELDWQGIRAGSASLNVPYGAALSHFMSGKPVRAGTVKARGVVLDLNQEAVRALKSTLILGGYTAPTLDVGAFDVQAEAIDGGYRVARSLIQTDIGTFAYQGDVVNGRLANGTLTLTGAPASFEGMMATMTRLSGGRDQREGDRLRLIFP